MQPTVASGETDHSTLMSNFTSFGGAGLDLSEHKARSAIEVVGHSASWHAAFERLQFGRLPVIAILRGAVIGGGLELALACHYRCAVAGTQLGLPEVKLGLLPGASGTQRLPRLIGAERALDVMVSGDPLSAEQALELRLLKKSMIADGGDEA